MTIGSTIHQDVRVASSVSQRWHLSIDGYLVHGSNPGFTLVPEPFNGGHRLVIGDHVSCQAEHRFGLLTPEIIVENDIQILKSWTITLLVEWKRFNEKSVQKIAHRVANWPTQPFFIGAHDGMALAPERSEAFSFVGVKKMSLGQTEHFKWVYQGGFLVHCATGLVLHASGKIKNKIKINKKLTKPPPFR